MTNDETHDEQGGAPARGLPRASSDDQAPATPRPAPVRPATGVGAVARCPGRAPAGGRTRKRTRRKTADGVAMARLAEDVAAARAAVAGLFFIGQQMANACFNLGQHALDAEGKPRDGEPDRPLTGRQQRSLAEGQRDWDATCSRHRDVIRRAVDAFKEAARGH